MTTLPQPLTRPHCARAGDIVRKRLASDPSVHKIAVDLAEIYGASQFISDAECDHLIGMIDRVARPSTVFDPEYTLFTAPAIRAMSTSMTASCG